MALLIGMSNGIKGKTYDVANGRTAIGRNSTNILVFENDTISGRHCVIEKTGKRFVLKDLGSTNGTRVNSREITEVDLKPKDLIQIGSLEFMFDADPDEIVGTAVDMHASVEIAEGPVQAPQTFNSISPFGSRKDSHKLWYFLIGVIGVVALAAVVLFIVKLMRM